jgi:hypothetical protein
MEAESICHLSFVIFHLLFVSVHDDPIQSQITNEKIARGGPRMK